MIAMLLEYVHLFFLKLLTIVIERLDCYEHSSHILYTSALVSVNSFKTSLGHSINDTVFNKCLAYVAKRMAYLQWMAVFCRIHSK